MYTYKAKIVAWLDGDTVDIDIDLGFHITLRKRLRVAGLDTPEVHGESKEAGLAAKRFAAMFCPAGIEVEVKTEKSGDEKYGRFLAHITLADGVDFAKGMITAGHGKAYDGGKK